MTKFEKIYVGKGTMPQEGMEIIRFTIKMEALEQLVYEYEGEKMVTLEVAKMKQADNYDRTHTVYGTVKNTVPTPQKNKGKGKNGK